MRRLLSTLPACASSSALAWIPSMRTVLIGAILILLPAIVVIFYFWGNPMMIPAIASLCIAGLPFVAFAALLRNGDGGEGGEH